MPTMPPPTNGPGAGSPAGSTARGRRHATGDLHRPHTEFLNNAGQVRFVDYVDNAWQTWEVTDIQVIAPTITGVVSVTVYVGDDSSLGNFRGSVTTGQADTWRGQIIVGPADKLVIFCDAGAANAGQPVSVTIMGTSRTRRA